MPVVGDDEHYRVLAGLPQYAADEFVGIRVVTLDDPTELAYLRCINSSEVLRLHVVPEEVLNRIHREQYGQEVWLIVRLTVGARPCKILVGQIIELEHRQWARVLLVPDGRLPNLPQVCLVGFEEATQLICRYVSAVGKEGSGLVQQVRRIGVALGGCSHVANQMTDGLGDHTPVDLLGWPGTPPVQHRDHPVALREDVPESFASAHVAAHRHSGQQPHPKQGSLQMGQPSVAVDASDPGAHLPGTEFGDPESATCWLQGDEGLNPVFAWRFPGDDRSPY